MPPKASTTARKPAGTTGAARPAAAGPSRARTAAGPSAGPSKPRVPLKTGAAPASAKPPVDVKPPINVGEEEWASLMKETYGGKQSAEWYAKGAKSVEVRTY